MKESGYANKIVGDIAKGAENAIKRLISVITLQVVIQGYSMGSMVSKDSEIQ
ncbi:MAG: hypothetical protein [aquatic viral metagenome]